ncbi:methyltransferase domain-containing protein [Planctomycetota bacterium]|nr:methyltransferase domain-containing protein [Planctomycetota bacterium]
MAYSRNPQAEQMADESMVRNLRAQMECIWPQELAMLHSYELSDHRVLDLACGTGEFATLLLSEFAGVSLIGVDVEQAHLNTATAATIEFGSRAEFKHGDAFELDFPDDHFDLTVNRHMLQAVPHAEKVVDEIIRVTKPGGRIHILAEDYAMMHFWPTTLDADRFWHEGPMTYAQKTGTDLKVGRKVGSWLRERGLQGVRTEYILIDAQHVNRDDFAAIWTAWRDGYTQTIAEHTELTAEQVTDYWNDMIQCIKNPNSHACWKLPVITAIN